MEHKKQVQNVKKALELETHAEALRKSLHAEQEKCFGKPVPNPPTKKTAEFTPPPHTARMQTQLADDVTACCNRYRVEHDNPKRSADYADFCYAFCVAAGILLRPIPQREKRSHRKSAQFG